jgi:hypothetical protein
MEILSLIRRPRPEPWSVYKKAVRRRWTTPFWMIEYVWEWMVFALSNWAFLELLQYLSTFSVLVVVIFYFAESGDRQKQKHYQAWQVINTAQGKGGNGGRIDALQELNADKVPLVGVDVSEAFLRGLRLDHADLLRADLHAADLRESVLTDTDFKDANLDFTNLRNSSLRNADFEDAALTNADLAEANLSNADLSGADLADANLDKANLQGVKWRKIENIKGANIYGVTNAPAGFVEWAISNGAMQVDKE